VITVYDLGKITDWLSSIGTISAVIVALYLARRERKPRAIVSSTVSYGISAFGASNGPIHLNLSIVNIGSIPIHLKECTVQVNKWSKDRMAFLDGSHNVDKLLGPGEYYEHTLSYEELRKFYVSKKVKKINTYGYFKDGVGKKYKTKVRMYF
jgi:hypothetical protein